MAHIIRCLSEEGAVVILAEDSTDMVETARQYTGSSRVCTAALGRSLTAASIMGYMLKNNDDSVTLRFSGDGPAGSVITAADADGNARGYIMNPGTALPLRESDGKLDVGGVVGKNGTLTVIKDIGLPEPVMGQVPLVSGEIAEDVTGYYAMSEQVPTVCSLGVLVNPDDTVAVAGGFIIQLLPTADDEIIDRVENGLKGLPSVTTMLAGGMSLLDICKKALPDFEIGVLDETDCAYRCNCSKQRVEKALISTGKASLEEMAGDPETRVRCHFCPTEYVFTPHDIRELIKKATR